jgi:hypothetical protein
MTVFTMTIRSVGKMVIKSGTSRVGEEWEATLGRLYHETIPLHEPRRRVVFMTYHGFVVGSPTNMVIMGSDGEYPDERQDPPLFITTDPPQF